MLSKLQESFGGGQPNAAVQQHGAEPKQAEYVDRGSDDDHDDNPAAGLEPATIRDGQSAAVAGQHAGHERPAG
jgi:hypothetical protein